MMAICTPRGFDDYECTCPPGTFGDGYVGCQQGECLKDDDCSLDKACMDYFCINPCLTNSTCSAQDFCQVRNHIPVCGFNQDAPPAPRNIVIGGQYTRAQDNEPRTLGNGGIVIGGAYSGGRDERRPSSSSSGVISARSRSRDRGVIGAHYRKRRSGSAFNVFQIPLGDL